MKGSHLFWLTRSKGTTVDILQWVSRRKSLAKVNIMEVKVSGEAKQNYQPPDNVDNRLSMVISNLQWITKAPAQVTPPEIMYIYLCICSSLFYLFWVI
jgi:hypothetical protein